METVVLKAKRCNSILNMDGPTMRLKIAILGYYGSGKTSLINRFVKDEFSMNTMTTMGKDVYTKKLTLDEIAIELEIWDTAGQERFRAMTGSVLNGSAGIILVYDITRKESFNEVKFWIQEIASRGSPPKILVIGNKTDLENDRRIPTEKGLNFARKHKIGFMETSALSNHKVEASFSLILNDIVNDKKHDPISPNKTGIEREVIKINTESHHSVLQSKKKRNCKC